MDVYQRGVKFVSSTRSISIQSETYSEGILSKSGRNEMESAFSNKVNQYFAGPKALFSGKAVTNVNGSKLHSVSYILKTPQGSLASYSITFNTKSKNSQDVKLLNVTVSKIGSNFKCHQLIQDNAQKSMKYTKLPNGFGTSSATLTFMVNR